MHQDMNQLQAKLHRALFPSPPPIIVTEQHADPVELVFQAFLRLAPEQRTRLSQRLKWRWGALPAPLSSKAASCRSGFLGWLTGSERRTEAATRDDELRNRSADLRNKIEEVLENHPELRDLIDEIALKQGMRVQVGASFLERVQADLEERARAIIERRPDLEQFFDHDDQVRLSEFLESTRLVRAQRASHRP
ncbi:MAG TPA: hypothetical protein VKR62_18210 [Roseiarcus sp.]|nr:hypothetical protein [Roseiarcus sp.]